MEYDWFFFKRFYILEEVGDLFLELSYFSVLTPYYTEEVLFSSDDLDRQNEDGVSILFYLQKIYPGLLVDLIYLVFCC